MKKLRTLIIILIFNKNIYCSQSLKISVPKDVYNDYKIFLQKKDPLQITSYKRPKSRRDVVEIILLQKALVYGGGKQKIKITTPSSSYQRIITELENGTVDISGTSMWKESTTGKALILLSSPVIRAGEFEAGIYISSKHKPVPFDQISKLSFISNRQWTVDWKTLTNLKLKVFSTTKWTSMIRMVDAQRIDATLAPFSSHKDLTITAKEILDKKELVYTLIPIKKVKVLLQSTRHFAISSKLKNSNQLLTIINKGIKILRKKKEIVRAYQESGFFNKKTKHWKHLSTLIKKIKK
jgi:hypothetical protein